jgi:hypothetical protein
MGPLSYFSPPAGKLNPPKGSGSAPVKLKLRQKVSIQVLPYTNHKISLYFNHEEFKDTKSDDLVS